MLDPFTWSFFWPAFLFGCVVVVTSGSRRLKCLTAATVAGLATYAGIFLFTNWEVGLHIQQAYPRLLVHLTPAAAVVIGAGGAHVWSLAGRAPAQARSRMRTVWTTALRKPIVLFLFQMFSILVGAAALACGARALRRDAFVFTGPPRTPFPSEFRRQFRTVTERLPAGAFVLHLSASPESWYSRLWQRALYPRNDSIVMQPPLSPERVQEMRSKYGARFAISAGDPPFDPGYVWRIDLGRLPKVPSETWFGELGP
jgi:hypothetical protein